MKKYKLELKPHIRPRANYGEIGKRMFFEVSEEKPTVDMISNDYTDQVEHWIDRRNWDGCHEDWNGINKRSRRIG